LPSYPLIVAGVCGSTDPITGSRRR